MAFTSNTQADGLFGDCVKENESFRLLGARLGGKRATAYGDTETAQLLIGTPSAPTGLWLSIIGEAIVREVGGLTPSDFPTECVVTRIPTKNGSQVKVLRPITPEDRFQRAHVLDPPAVHTAPPTPQQQGATVTPTEDDIPF